ncbi:unnamed protein product [Caenorhabditis nigoni]
MPNESARQGLMRGSGRSASFPVNEANKFREVFLLLLIICMACAAVAYLLSFFITELSLSQEVCHKRVVGYYTVAEENIQLTVNQIEKLTHLILLYASVQNNGSLMLSDELYVSRPSDMKQVISVARKRESLKVMIAIGELEPNVFHMVNSDPVKKKMDNTLEYSTFGLIFIILALFSICIRYYMRYRKYAKMISNDAEMAINQGEDISIPVVDNQGEVGEISTQVVDNKISYETYKKRFEIDRERLNVVSASTKLGEGYFGLVLRAELKRNDSDEKLMVAIKVAHNSEEKQEILIKEILAMCVMADKKHPNVLAIVGANTSNPLETLIAMELAATDLKNYIKKNKNGFVDLLTGDHKTDDFTINYDFNVLSSLDLILFAYQISNGMEHLTNIPCVHRDLALRNILITERKIIRIGDFGLAIKYEDQNYYSKSTIRAVPRHSAPEILTEGRYTEKSDIWSFGICLYELFTLGKTPLRNLKGDLIKGFSSDGNSKYCRSEIIEFLEMCLDLKPRRRPNFQTCVYTFKCELNRFSDQIHREIEEKLDLEARQQLELETWGNPEVSHGHTE